MKSSEREVILQLKSFCRVAAKRPAITSPTLDDPRRETRAVNAGTTGSGLL